MSNNLLPRIFRYFNKFFMVPLFRLGLGPFVGNPITGYIMVLKTTGRKTGKTRFTPTNYTIRDGIVYWAAGFGARTHWLLNIQANPQVEILLPGRSISGAAEVVADPEESTEMLWWVLKDAGVPGFFAGFNPYTISKEEFKIKTEDLTVLRLRKRGITKGPFDAGGWFWLVMLAGSLAIVYLLLSR
ncbi:MAG: nitroreductase family deazaflavin-dependent oxidoreductase [Anaerolineae bacterium]|nr:nitroreductase family deazaflavin-dependent oxidoreductase [Anaerolineae bacterium]